MGADQPWPLGPTACGSRRQGGRELGQASWPLVQGQGRYYSEWACGLRPEGCHRVTAHRNTLCCPQLHKSPHPGCRQGWARARMGQGIRGGKMCPRGGGPAHCRQKTHPVCARLENCFSGCALPHCSRRLSPRGTCTLLGSLQGPAPHWGCCAPLSSPIPALLQDVVLFLSCACGSSPNIPAPNCREAGVFLWE